MTQSQYSIGVDIGGTKINAARVCLSGDDPLLGEPVHSPTPNTLDEFIDGIVNGVEACKQQGTVGAVGISTAGSVDSERGCIIGATGNLPFIKGELQLKKILQERTKLPVHVENDANAAAYGEIAMGAARGHQHMVMVTLGTGVGVGVVMHGKMVRGSHYSAEGGHIVIKDEGRMCTCGRPDCWEAYASGKGFNLTIRQMLHKASAEEQQKFLAGGDHNLDTADTHDWARALKDQQALAQAMRDQWHKDVALGIINIINMVDPDSIVVGGGLMGFVDFEKLAAIVKPRVLTPTFSILPAKLGNDAGMVGAAFLASQSVPIGV